MAVYVETRGEPLPDFAWFEALIRFKEASASALLTKRAMKAGIDDPDRLVTPVLTLIEQTIEQTQDAGRVQEWLDRIVTVNDLESVGIVPLQ